MALGKYTRIEGHNSSCYCVTIVIVVFISTCFLGAWMAMSTSIGPLGLGVHLQQLMGGMPKKLNLNDTDLHEDALKVNDSQSAVQDDSSLIMLGNVKVTPTEPQNLDIAQNGKIAPTAAEKSFSLNAEENKGSQEKNSGPPEEADTSNQEVPTDQYVDSAVQSHDSDCHTEPGEVSNKIKQVGEMETSKVDETREYPEIIPSAWINAKKMQGKMVNQTEKPTKEQSEILRREPANVSPGLLSDDEKEMSNETSAQVPSYRWKVCNVTAGPDYIPCLDNVQVIKKLQTTRHYEHRERHCPDEAPVCLVPLPEGYKTPIKWPKSRDMIWFSNVPHTKLVEYKGAQNWVKVYDRPFWHVANSWVIGFT